MAREHRAEAVLSDDEPPITANRRGATRSLRSIRSSARRQRAGWPLLQLLDDLLRLALLLDQPEVWVLLDHHFDVTCDVPRRHHKAVRSLASLLPLRT